MNEVDEEKLIALVRQYPNLYDSELPEYLDSDFRTNTWEQIGTRLNKPAALCRSRWKSLRKCHRRALRKRESESGQSGRKQESWRLHLLMEFLRPPIVRPLRVNLSDEETESGRKGCLLNNKGTKLERSDLNTNRTVSNNPDSQALKNDNTDEPTTDGENEDTKDLDELKLCVARSNKRTASPRPVHSDWKKPRTLTPAAGASQAHVTVMKQQHENRQKPSVAPRVDHLTKYFQSLEETIRSLPVALQIRVKSQFSQIIHDAELEAVNTTHPPQELNFGFRDVAILGLMQRD